MSTTVVTFGEIMLRLAPPGFERFLQSPNSWRPLAEGRPMWPSPWLGLACRRAS